MKNPRVCEIEFIPVDTSLIIKTKEKLSNILKTIFLPQDMLKAGE